MLNLIAYFFKFTNIRGKRNFFIGGVIALRESVCLHRASALVALRSPTARSSRIFIVPQVLNHFATEQQTQQKNQIQIYLNRILIFESIITYTL